MDKVTRQISGDTNKLRGDYVTMTIYFRLFIADMFPQYDKAIYIDADTVAEDDLTTLFATDLGDNLVAGVVDPVMMTYPETMNLIQRDFGIQPGKYINSGVLVMNLAHASGAFFRSVLALVEDLPLYDDCCRPGLYQCHRTTSHQIFTETLEYANRSPCGCRSWWKVDSL